MATLEEALQNAQDARIWNITWREAGVTPEKVCLNCGGEWSRHAETCGFCEERLIDLPDRK